MFIYLELFIKQEQQWLAQAVGSAETRCSLLILLFARCRLTQARCSVAAAAAADAAAAAAMYSQFAD